MTSATPAERLIGRIINRACVLSQGVEPTIGSRRLDHIHGLHSESILGAGPASSSPNGGRGPCIAGTRHEAVQKCHGAGIWGTASSAAQRTTWITGLEIGQRASGAVAAERPPRELCCLHGGFSRRSGCLERASRCRACWGRGCAPTRPTGIASVVLQQREADEQERHEVHRMQNQRVWQC